MKLRAVALLSLMSGAAAGCIQPANSASADPAVLKAGERAYQKCYSCHSLEGSDVTTQGPSLRNILGRRVASESGFDYSPALRAYAAQQPRWTGSALNDFIADPESKVPGNDMGFVGIADPSERRALIAYLSTK